MKRVPVLFFVCACGTTPPVAPEPPRPRTTAPLDACQRELRSRFEDAKLPPRVRLVSSESTPDAARYDAWLRALSAAVRPPLAYAWVSLDDDAGRKLARDAGLEGPGVVIDVGVDRSAVPLANGLAAVARAAGGGACDAVMPPAASSERPRHDDEPRDALVSSAAIARATSLRIDEPTRSVTLVQDGATWKLAPSGARADQDDVKKALENLAEATLGDGIGAGPDADAALGLGAGSGTHVVLAAGDATLVDLTIGRSGARGTAVRVGAAPEARIAHGLLSFRFQHEPRIWRDRTIWQLDTAAVRRIEITSDHAWVLTRRGDAWRATRDGRSATFDRARIDGMLRAFRHPPAEDFAEPGADTGLDKHAAVLRFVSADGSVHAMRIGRERPDHTFYAQVEGEPTIYVIVAYQASFARP